MPASEWRTEEELKAARARKVIEYAALPDKSAFGDDNRAAEKLLLRTFDRIIAGADPDELQGRLYETADLGGGMDYVTDAAIALCDWAKGWEDDLFEAKEA